MPLLRTRRTDVEGTQRLLGAAARAGVAHVVYVSIVGIDRAATYVYYRAKLAAERAIEASGLPYTILRAAQFFELALRRVVALDRRPVLLVPDGFPGQPIDAGDVAGRSGELARGVPVGRAQDIGGPEVRTLGEAARDYLRMTGSRKRVVPFRLPGSNGARVPRGCVDVPGKPIWPANLERVPPGSTPRRASRVTRRPRAPPPGARGPRSRPRPPSARPRGGRPEGIAILTSHEPDGTVRYGWMRRAQRLR